MNASDHDHVKEALLIEGLRDWIHLSEVHSAFIPDTGPRPPLEELQELTLNMIHELVSEGLFVLGQPSPTKDDPTDFTQWQLPLDAAMAKIKDAYVNNFEDRHNWITMVWMNQTDKGEKLALELYHAEEPTEKHTS
jgi:hypothetical protein